MAKLKDSSVELPRLFTRLQRAIEDEEDEQVLDLTKTILELSRDDPDAIHCRLISLIHLSRFDSALELIHKLNKKRKSSEGKLFQLEEAYCLYRLEKYGETVSILSRLSQDSVQVGELVAQVAYRQEQYSKALETYQWLLEEDKNQQERVANYYAALCLYTASPYEEGMAPSLSPPDTMEQCFNLACCHLARGVGQQAMDMLRMAESLYRQSLEDEGLTEEEISEEIAVIEVQKGYCFHVSQSVCMCVCYAAYQPFASVENLSPSSNKKKQPLNTSRTLRHLF